MSQGANYSLISPLLGSDSSGNVVPTIGDPSAIYKFDDYLYNDGFTTPFNVSGTGTLHNGTASGTPLVTGITANQQGFALAKTTSASAGGSIGAGGICILSKNGTFQWRIYFMMPNVLSTAANRYVLSIGADYKISGTPWSGPYIAYTDNVNSGNWTLNSLLAGSATTTINTAITPPAVSTWHTLTITLVGTVYTFLLDGASLGTVTETGLTTAQTPPAIAGGSIGIIPNTAWTTTTYILMDRSDFYVTGLSR